jgi:hypothetical protein
MELSHDEDEEKRIFLTRYFTHHRSFYFTWLSFSRKQSRSNAYMASRHGTKGTLSGTYQLKLRQEVK